MIWLRNLRLTVFAAGLMASAMGFVASGQLTLLVWATGFHDPAVLTRYRISVLPTNAFEAEIRSALDEGRTLEARQLVVLATEFGHTVPSDLVEETQEDRIEFAYRSASEFLKGVLYGDTSSVVAISGALAADYAGFGDARDVFTEGALMVRGEEYDQITLGLAVFGLATILPGTGTLDMTASLFKNANRARKISRPLFAKVLLSTSQLTDAKLLKEGLSELSDQAMRIPSLSAAISSLRTAEWAAVVKGDYASVQNSLRALSPVDVSSARAAVRKSIRPEKVEELRSLLQSADSLVSQGGVMAGLRGMQLADDAEELARFGRVAASLRNTTSAALRILGKNAITLGKLIYQLAGTMFATALWLVGLLAFLKKIAYLYSRRSS